MHPVRRPALVHPAFENPAVSSGTNPHIASGRTALAPKPVLCTRETCACRVRVAHRQAGQLLRRFHDAMTGSLVQPEAARVVENTVAGLDKHLAEAGDHLPAALADTLRHLVSTLSDCGPLLAGWRHGDFWERNLLWNGSRWALIDFGRGEPGPLVTEKPPPDCHPYTVAIFRMLTHGPSHRALNWPTGGAR
ncbi:phosphotransferase [Streptomyces melanosporofaciens]|uniref:phosphotransferase n=1 Tax=unclassified Streptomyces TaxID=2593676 RepID=UPI003680F873